MSNLQFRQEKIQEKRKQTPWREFLMEIGTWYSLMFYKNRGLMSLYPYTDRTNIVSLQGSLNSEGIEYDYDNNFLDDLTVLMQKSTLPALNHWGQNENAEYTETAVNVKNSYLSFTVTKGSQNVLYSVMVRESNDVVNSIDVVDGSSIVYSSVAVVNSTSVFYSKYIIDSNSIRLSTNLIGCSECVLCQNLQNQSYCIRNKQYTKEEYYKEKNQLLNQKGLFVLNVLDFDKSNNYGSDDAIGKFILKSVDIDTGYMVNNWKKGRNLIMIGNIDDGEEGYDFMIGGAGCKHIYGSVNSGNYSEHLYCSWGMGKCYMCFYSYKLEECSFCLGCIGLKNKSYCILNKQYTKEEWYEKVDEIFTQMEKDGQLGEFFPATMNPFYFNDTAAYLIDPSFTKEEVTARGYLRRDEPIKVDIPEGMEIVKTSELGSYEGFDSEGNRSINADILKKVIQDEQGNVYRIIPMEYKFLVKHGLPLPRKHWLERMKENFRIN